jgi:hypothetical protein
MPALQEGRPRQECYTPQVLQQIQADSWSFAAPGGESQKQLEDRVVRGARCATQCLQSKASSFLSQIGSSFAIGCTP